MKVTREELLRLASISKLEIHESELEGLMNQLQAVLTYAERVNQVADDVDIASSKNVNIMRNDTVYPFNFELIIAQAPIREDDFFVVPKIL